MKFKIIIVFLYLSISFLPLISLNANDNIIQKKRQNFAGKMFFSGEINFTFFYLFDNWQGTANDHLADFGYTTRDFTSDEYYTDGMGGTKRENPWGGIDTGFYGNLAVQVPFLDTKHPFFKRSNLKLQFDWVFNWMQADIGGQFIIQPLPFYYAAISIKAGTGWDWLWRSDGNAIFHGLGLNTRDGFVNTPFGGALITFSIKNVLQMNLAALPFIPEKAKRWSNVIIKIESDLYFQGLTSAHDSQLYHYRTLDNLMNGWNNKTIFMLGYIFQIINDTINYQSFRRIKNKRFEIMTGFITEIEFSLSHYNDSPMRNGWGSDFINLTLKPITIFFLPGNLKLIIIPVITNEKRFTEETVGNVYLKTKIYQDWYMNFAKIGFVFGWEF